jgi:plastocyanin
MRILKPVLVAVTLVALGVATANALAEPKAQPARTAGVSVKDDFFSPSSKTVTKGTTVKWTWRGRDPHNVTVTSGPARFASSTKTQGTFSKRLTRTGTYKIVCTIHSMQMTLKVKRP